MFMYRCGFCHILYEDIKFSSTNSCPKCGHEVQLLASYPSKYEKNEGPEETIQTKVDL